MAIVWGTNGNDLFRARAEEELFLGGAGIDRVDYSASPSRILVRLAEEGESFAPAGSGGFAAGDVLIGIEQVVGSRGNDIITGNSADNLLAGQNGQDRLNGGRGDDTLLGGAHDDVLFGGADDDVLIGGAGSDYMDGDGGIDTVSFADLNDGVGVTVKLSRFFATHGAEVDTIGEVENVIGTAFDDYISGDGAANVLRGEGGSDQLTGFENDDQLSGGAGDDDLFGGEGRDTLSGGTDDDLLWGDGGNDILLGGTGNDEIVGGAGADRIDGGDGFDVLSYSGSFAAVRVDLAAGRGRGGEAEGDVIKNIESLEGSSLGDTLSGSVKDETFDGYTGADTIDARGGADILTGGHGDDTLTGGEGADTFVFDYHFPLLEGPNFGHDIVTDFELGTDHIRIGSQSGGVTLRLEQVGDDTVMTRSGFGETVTFLDMDRGALKEALAADGFLF